MICDKIFAERSSCTEEAAVFGVWKNGCPFRYCSCCWSQAKPTMDNIVVQYDTEYRLVDGDEAVVIDILWR